MRGSTDINTNENCKLSEQVAEYKYLDINISSSGNWQQQIQNRIEDTPKLYHAKGSLFSKKESH